VLFPCSFIILTAHTKSQMQALGLYSRGPILGRIFGLVYRGAIFGDLYSGFYGMLIKPDHKAEVI